MYFLDGCSFIGGLIVGTNKMWWKAHDLLESLKVLYWVNVVWLIVKTRVFLCRLYKATYCKCQKKIKKKVRKKCDVGERERNESLRNINKRKVESCLIKFLIFIVDLSLLPLPTKWYQSIVDFGDGKHK